MKLKVNKGFVDKFTGEFYKADQKIEIDDQNRVNDLIDRGLAEKAAEKEAKKTEEPKKSKKK